MRNLILSGGVAHPYDETSAALARILNEIGIRSEIDSSFASVEDGGLLEFDLLTINCVRWTCNTTPGWYDEYHFEISEAARQGFLAYLNSGGGVLAFHAATICFDDWPIFPKILGGYWDWEGSSSHLEYGEFAVAPTTINHPITCGLDGFNIVDELYINPRIVGEIEVLATSEGDGVTHPIVWTNRFEGARVVYDALGHDAVSFAQPVHRELIKQAANWVIGSREAAE
ncbi:MAG: ThuA domain-containing protein [Candidatus Latescibacteria bacterium]|jgi:hypothetical protein|nr:ThuA domain-containing protein [Candidatus Latescibacterota bacterium]